MQDTTRVKDEFKEAVKDVGRKFDLRTFYLNESWFERKKGIIRWQPVSWQGWALFIAYIVLSINLFFRALNSSSHIGFALVGFIPVFIVTTAAFIIICLLTERKA